jgi:hypothetical protein
MVDAVFRIITLWCAGGRVDFLKVLILTYAVEVLLKHPLRDSTHVLSIRINMQSVGHKGTISLQQDHSSLLQFNSKQSPVGMRIPVVLEPIELSSVGEIIHFEKQMRPQDLLNQSSLE